jgi:hypothetical protein
MTRIVVAEPAIDWMKYRKARAAERNDAAASDRSMEENLKRFSK